MNFREAMEYQAQFGDANGAPITARVCRALADAIDESTITGARVLGWPGDYVADAVPLRLVAPLHFLFRSGRSPAIDPLFRGEATDDVGAVRAAIADHDAEIARWLDGPPQTNEPGRSAAFMAALLVLADMFGPDFELIEIGSSAGLNLLIDRYRYDLGGVMVGPATSPITITPAWRGPPPPDAPVNIVSVKGADIALVDVTDADAAERLLSYVWVDQAERFARTEAAIEMVRTRPPMLEQADAADYVEKRLDEPQAAHTTRVLMHSIVWQYLSSATQARITAAMEKAGASATRDAPIAWIAFEADRAISQHMVRLRIWPGNADILLARAQPHASWIEWLPQESA